MIVHHGISPGAIAVRRSTRPFLGCLAVAVVCLTAARLAFAQEALNAVRDLYRAAAYEDALVRLNTLRPSAHVTDESRSMDEYRALCLLALGRTVEAERAIEAVVTAAPSFHFSEADASPRIRAAFSDVRQRMLPGIIQQQYAQAKTAFERNELVSARAGFQRVLDLLADDDLRSTANKPPLSELRTLALGFRDLAVKADASRPVSPRPAGTLSTSIASAPAPRTSTPRVYGIEDTKVVPPLVVRQSWEALAGVFAVRPGVVTIVVDETGAVEAVAMTGPVNPVYDRLAISTAKGWRYRPATLDGVSVKFRKVVQLDPKAAR